CRRAIDKVRPLRRSAGFQPFPTGFQPALRPYPRRRQLPHTSRAALSMRAVWFAQRQICHKVRVMRMIGHLPNESSAATFSDFLYVEGISNLVEVEKDGWAVWIHSEDQLEKARELLLSYLGNPKDPKYQRNSARAAELKQREEHEEKVAETKVYGRERLFGSTGPFGIGPLTFLLILFSVAVWGFM